MRSTMHLVLAAMVGLTACSSSPKRGDAVIESTEIKADSAQAQQRYEAGLALLIDGQWASAEEEFRLLQSEFPEDPIAQVAELYAARAALRDLETADAGPQRALPLLSGLARSEDVDTRIRYAAQIYLAAAHAALNDRVAAMDALDRYPGASLSPNVLSRDRPAAWTFVVEALAEQGRKAEAVAACAETYREGAENAQMRRFALSRGFELAPGVDQDILLEWSTDDTTFLRAIGGYELSRQLRSQADADVLDRAIAALSAIGEDARAQELSLFRPTETARALRIGVLLPLSGPNKAIGDRALQGAMLASLNTPRGEVTLVIEDAEQAGAFDRLKEREVLAIVGPLDPARTRTIAPLAAEHEIPVLALTTEIPATTDPWVFQDFVDADLEADAAAWLGSQVQATRVAIVAPNIGYGQRMATRFRQAAEAAGMTVVLDTTYDRKATDFSKVASSVANAKPDAIYIPDTGSKVAEVTAFMAAKNIWGRTHGVTPPRDGRTRVYYLGTSLWQDENLVRQAGSYVEGALIPAWYSAAFTDDASRRFFERWAAAGHTSRPAELEIFGYDAVTHLVAEIKRVPQTNGVALKTALLDADPSTGISAATWATNGKARRSLGFITVTDSFQATPWTYNSPQVDRAPALP